MKNNFITLFILCAFVFINAQNIFSVKLNNCNTDVFCLDCGDTKASYDTTEFQKLIEKLNNSLNLKGISGSVKLQVLIDSKGRGCVLSHTDISNRPITLKIIDGLNNLKKWKPAITDDKKEKKTSINLVFLIKDNTINGNIERVDLKAFKKSFDRPTSPEIYNKNYTYKNENLENYRFTVWNSLNSNLENNFNNHITFDKFNHLWITTDGGLETFDGTNFVKQIPDIIDTENTSIHALETDSNDRIWIYATYGKGINGILNFHNNKWTIISKEESGLDGVYNIINNSNTNELFFCSDKGLTVLKNGNWSNISTKELKELPSNRVYYAKKDSEGKIWIGTFSGTVVIDEKGKVTNFENTSTILKGKCITSMDEDENGNLYFSLLDLSDKNKGKVNRDEGIAIRNADGIFKQFTTDNSGLPFNHANCVLYNKSEKILWISTDRAGLVRFDLKDNWENYHNENSEIPTSYISTMKFDKNGNLFLATRQGIVEVQKK